MELLSPSTKEPCKPPHYLAELAVTRYAKHLRVPLPFKFWNTDEWKKEYRQQIIAANSLLKLFEPEVLLAVLESKDGNWIYSLNQPKLIDLAKREQARITIEKKFAESSKKLEYDPNNVNVVPNVQSKPNTMSKLRGLDG